MAVRVETDKRGTRRWYRGLVVHRDDGPAVEYFDGSRQWMRDGKLHRSDGPANEWSDGSWTWATDGKWHRDGDAPAIYNAEWGFHMWYVNNEFHRDGGRPAGVWTCGCAQWYVHNVFQSKYDCPACVSDLEERTLHPRPEDRKRTVNVRIFYALEDERDAPCSEANGWHTRYGGLPVVKNANGTKQWWVLGRLPGDGELPAVVRAEGSMEWWVNDEHVDPPAP